MITHRYITIEQFYASVEKWQDLKPSLIKKIKDGDPSFSIKLRLGLLLLGRAFMWAHNWSMNGLLKKYKKDGVLLQKQASDFIHRTDYWYEIAR